MGIDFVDEDDNDLIFIVSNFVVLIKYLFNMVACMIFQAEIAMREEGKPGMSDEEVCFFIFYSNFLSLFLVYFLQLFFV